VHVTLKAVIAADRSTFSFLRIITLPLLALVDVLLGYPLAIPHIVGIGLIVVSLIFLFINHGIRKKGVWYTLLSAVNAVATISLFKYDITYFNSPEAEQGITTLILLAYMLFMAHYYTRERPFRMLRQPVFLLQSLAMGVGSILSTFAYLFAPASVITALLRSSSVLYAILFGRKVFHEKGIVIKLTSAALLIAGIVLLTFGVA
jgi:drug/metabolite transporter (DMT)-like permease